MLAGEVAPVIDDRILAEYREVLARPKFSFDKQSVGGLLLYFERAGVTVSALPWHRPGLPDPDDAIFLEVAAAAKALLVTGNLRHFPPDQCQDVVVMSPSAFLNHWQQQQE